jgi:hypothetical protein
MGNAPFIELGEEKRVTYNSHFLKFTFDNMTITPLENPHSKTTKITVKLNEENWLFLDSGLSENCVVFLTRNELRRLRTVFNVKMTEKSLSLWDMDVTAQICKSDSLFMLVEGKKLRFRCCPRESIITLIEKEQWMQICT